MRRLLCAAALLVTIPAARADEKAALDAEVRFRIGAEDYVARVPKESTRDRWLSGPLVQEARYRVSPVSASGQRHPFLDVLFDVRSYADGPTRLDVTVENVLDVPSATVVSYDVEIRAQGSTLFQHEQVKHFYLTRWRKVFVLGSSLASVTPDFGPFYQARAVPRYLASIPNHARPVAGHPFDILQGAELNPNMPDHGIRAELAPYPDWAAQYLVHRNPAQQAYVLANGDLAGSWPIHVCDAADHLPISIDKRPLYWIDRRAKPGNKPAGTPIPDEPYRGGKPSDPVHQSPLIPDNAHQCSLAYVPYLVTGDRYYADEMRYWANFGFLRTAPAQGRGREGSRGLLGKDNEVRGTAWALRNQVDAASYLPDNDPFKAYFTQKINNNLQWLDEWASTKGTPLGVAWLRLQPYERDKGKTRAWVKLQQHAFLAWSLDHVHEQGFTGGLKYRDQVARFVLRLFTDPGWQRANAGPYAIAVGDRVNGQKEQLALRIDPKVDAQIRYYSTLSEAYAKTFLDNSPARPFSGWEGPSERLMLQIGIKNGWEGAAEACSWLTPQLGRDLAARSGWMLDVAPADNDRASGSVPANSFHLGQGWATFGIALPAGAARESLQIGTLRTQTDVKVRWPDGSIRFAIVTAKTPGAGIYAVKNGHQQSANGDSGHE